MGLNFSELRWSLLGHVTYEVTTRNDFYCIQLQGTNKKLFRVDWKHDYFNDHTRLVGYLHGTVSLLNTEATIIHQKLYLGTNIIIIPPEIESINNFYLNHYKAYGGKFTIQYFEPTIQIVINPFTNQPVILGQESLESIETINQNFAQQIINQITEKINLQISQDLNKIYNHVLNLTTILSSAI